MEKLLLRPAEAAEILGIGRSKMYELLATKTVPTIQLGRSVRIPVEALQSWIKNQARVYQKGENDNNFSKPFGN